MEKMDQISESNGKTLLDNSLVYFGNEQSGGSSHEHTDVPILVGGTAGGKIRPGYWDYTFRPYAFYQGRKDLRKPVGSVPYNNFLVSMMKALGLEANEWRSSGQKGFGEFSLSKVKSDFIAFPKNRSPRKYAAKTLYRSYLGANGSEKTLPGWLKA